MNRNLSKNYPEFSAINHNKTESDFILQLVRKIEESVDFETLDTNKTFSEFLINRNCYLEFESTQHYL